MKRKILGIVALTGALLLTSCSHAPAEYSTIEDLRDAYVDAGGECPEFETHGPTDYSIEDARCSPSAVIAIYGSHEDVQRETSMVKNSVGKLLGGKRLIGENWMINGPDLEKIQKKMGGEIITFTKEDN